MENIYFDNAATTKVDDQVLQIMLQYLSENYGNPSSVHSLGQDATQAVDHSREVISNHLGCAPAEVIFTSCATESNNLAIWGVLNSLIGREGNFHFITTSIEHPSVMEIYKRIEKLGHEVTFLTVDDNGIINLEELKQAIKKNTVMVSVMFVNNEVGSIEPVSEVGEIVAIEKSNRESNDLPIYFHTDAVQAMNYLPVKVEEIKCDFLSFSGHKIHAPKGIGVLYIRKGVKIEKLTYGGNQEYGIRPGTLNVPSIVAIGEAIEILSKDQSKHFKNISKLRNLLIGELTKISEVKVNGQSDHQSPHVLNISFLKAEGESILMMLDMEGISVSTGSACSSGALEASPILRAMGVPVEWTHGSIRISLSRYSTQEECKKLISSITAIVDKLRKMAPEIK